MAPQSRRAKTDEAVDEIPRLSAAACVNLCKHVHLPHQFEPNPWRDHRDVFGMGLVKAPKPVEWASEIGIRMTDALAWVKVIGELESAKRHAAARNKEAGYRVGRTRYIADITSITSVEFFKELTQPHGYQKVFVADPERPFKRQARAQIEVDYDGAIRVNLKIGRVSLWSWKNSLKDLKFKLFGLALESAGKITANVAIAQALRFVANAMEINADPDALFRVDEIQAYGSMMKGADRCGDVDVVMRSVDRRRDQSESQGERDRLSKIKVPFAGGSYIDRLFAAEHQFKRKMKKGAMRVSYHSELPFLLVPEDAPLTLYRRDDPSIDALSVILQSRLRWLTPEMQRLRQAISDAVDSINTDPEVQASQANREMSEMHEVIRGIQMP